MIKLNQLFLSVIIFTIFVSFCGVTLAEEPLFQITDSSDNVILASYPDGVKVYDDTGDSLMTILTDSIRIYRNVAADSVMVTGFRMTTSADSGKILISDTDGNATWQNASAVADTHWTEETSPANFLRAKKGGIATNGATLYGTKAKSHINLGFGTSITGSNGYDYGFCTVSGGEDNTASGKYCTVGGGYQNTASDHYATIGGGDQNIASERYSTIGGGSLNSASEYYSTIGGGNENTASGYTSTIGGGNENTASGYTSTIGGGKQNTASDNYSTIGGGLLNTASGYNSTIDIFPK